MNQPKIFSVEEFRDFYKPVLKSYSKDFQYVIKSESEVSDIVFGLHNSKLILSILDEIIRIEDKNVKSLIYRVIAVREIIYCRENNMALNIGSIWNMIDKSIRSIANEFTISSIGSQGFLSIPLFKKDESLDTFDFLRLHIWDDTLLQYMDMNKVEDFSIHSHTFMAKSWIITGKVINDRYEFKVDSNGTHSFFEVKYNDSLNQVNQHSSKALNTDENVNLYKVSQEVHFPLGFYEIHPSRLHKSGHLNSSGCSATIFSFTGKDGLGKSFVIGPQKIRESEINRKVFIDPIPYLDKISSQLKNERLWIIEN